jgi:hypothetical protein
MRMAYFDEAGTSDMATEPFLVLAGIIVNADEQWKWLEGKQNAIRNEVIGQIPEERRLKFAFHATELFSGGKDFPREEWGKEERWQILERLASIPLDLNIPIIAAYAKRWEAPGSKDISAKARLAIMQRDLFVQAVTGVEQFMWFNASEKEVALIIAEEHQDNRTLMRIGQEFLKSSFATDLPPQMQEWLPLTRIVDTTHFATRLQSIPLQFADIAAFIIKRHLEGAKDSERFYKALVGSAIMEIPSSETSGWLCVMELRP